MLSNSSHTVIVADGEFPVHSIPLSYLKNASRIICCDGSTENLLAAGFIPTAIVGDMDSLNQDVARRFTDRIFRETDQETNDLTKAVNWCVAKGYNDIVIIGATGKREDHTIGNISLLAEYVLKTSVLMISDTGFFMPLTSSSTISCFPGQQISIFSIDINTEITSSGLKYSLLKSKISNWWQATLNEATGYSFSLEFINGRLIVYLKFK